MCPNYINAMCGHVLIGEQKDYVIHTRNGNAYDPNKGKKGGSKPGSMLPVVTDALPGKVQEYRWGLLRPDDDRIHSNNKHARLESVRYIDKWRDLVGTHHCVIRIEAFFEYSKAKEAQFRITRTDGQPFYIAGLWDIWFDVDTNILIPTFIMLTREPNTAMAEIHDRMPVILERTDIKTWLNASLSGEDACSA